MRYSELLSEELTPYLLGKEINTGLYVGLKLKSEVITSKDEYLCNISSNKDIIHFGFADHISIIEDKIKSNLWLHEKLINSSRICYGLDLNSEVVNFLKSKYSIERIYSIDIEKDSVPSEISNSKFDLLIIPDVIEHINNPVKFLKAINIKFKSNVEKIVITTPNVFRLKNLLELIRGREFINSDHRFWFSPFTITKILIESGFKVDNITYTKESFKQHLNVITLIKKFVTHMFPWLKAVLIIEARFS